MKYMAQLVNRAPLRSAVVQELKFLGIKAPKCRKISMKQATKTVGKVFGIPLNHMNLVIIDEEKNVKIPSILANLLSCLERGIEAEGLFRKTGSLIRQKEIRRKIENGQIDLKSAPVFDLASLLKQFLRELPEPLIFTKLHDSFLKAQSFESKEKRLKCILMLCLLLPIEHVNALKYVMTFLKRLASFSEKNKMDVHNLSLIMTPNVMQLNDNKSDKFGQKTLQIQTGIVSTLIEHAEEIGFIPPAIMEKVIAGPLGDELEISDSFTKKSKRRNSLNGVLRSIRRRSGQKSDLTQSEEDHGSQLSIDSNNLLDMQFDNCGNRVEKRSSSKRKADLEEANSTPVKKRLLSQNYETCFLAANGQIEFNKFNKSRLEAVRKSADISCMGTPNVNFDQRNFFTPTNDPKSSSKTSKTSKSTYKRFFSPAKLFGRRKYSMSASKGSDGNQTPYKFESTMSLDDPGNDTSINGSEIDAMTVGSIPNIAQEMLSYALKSRRSLTETNLCILIEDTENDSPISSKIQTSIDTGLPMTSSFKSPSNLSICEEVEGLEYETPMEEIPDDTDTNKQSETNLRDMTPKILSDLPSTEPLAMSIEPIAVEIPSENTPNQEKVEKTNNPRVSLTPTTQKLLANDGVIGEEAEDESTDEIRKRKRSSSLLFAKGVFDYDEEKLPKTPSCSRPSLVMLKTKRAGIVRENVKKFNAISENVEGEKATPARSFRCPNPTKTPGITPMKRGSTPSSSSTRCKSFSTLSTLPRISGVGFIPSTPSLGPNRTSLKVGHNFGTPKNDLNSTPVFKTPTLPRKMPMTTTPKLRNSGEKSVGENKRAVNRRLLGSTPSFSTIIKAK